MEKTPEEIKAILNLPEEKTDIQLQNEALLNDKKKDAELEKKLLDQHLLSKALDLNIREEEISVAELTARDLKQDLGGTIEQRIKGKKMIILTMEYGLKPEVVFSGFWNGRLVMNAMNAISRSYRVQRHKNTRANAATPAQV